MPVAIATAVDLTVQIDMKQAAVNHNRARCFFLGVYHGVTIIRLDGWKIGGPNPTGPENRHVVTIPSYKQTLGK